MFSIPWICTERTNNTKEQPCLPIVPMWTGVAKKILTELSYGRFRWERYSFQQEII
jgi:hypothetical protein